MSIHFSVYIFNIALLIFKKRITRDFYFLVLADGTSLPVCMLIAVQDESTMRLDEARCLLCIRCFDEF